MQEEKTEQRIQRLEAQGMQLAAIEIDQLTNLVLLQKNAMERQTKDQREITNRLLILAAVFVFLILLTLFYVLTLILP